MPYKDPLKQKEAQARHYKSNKDKYDTRTRVRAERNRAWLKEQKQGRKCKYCPEDDPRCLDFHHRDGEEKRATVCYMVMSGFAIQTIEEEIAKCDCVCANCHRKKHNGNVWEGDSYLLKRERSSIG